jgi:5-methylcytosine-specific restriction endonuclease McrA
MADPSIADDEAQRKREERRARQKAYDAAKYLANKKSINARRMAWARANRERQREVGRQDYWRNREKKLASKKTQYGRYREEVKERVKQYHLANKNSDRFKGFNRAKSARHKARRLGNGGSHTPADITAIAVAQQHRCAMCRTSIKKSRQIDHIIPLSKGGTNDRRNIQILCATCNKRKSAKHPLDFARELGLLL